MKLNSIQIKIVSVIILVLLVTIGFSVFLTLNNQKNDLMNATQKTLYLNTQILDTVVRSIMLSGEAPIAEITISNLKGIPDFKDIALFRTDGTSAFSDYKTLDFVNKTQSAYVFKQTPRLEKEIISNASFQKVLDAVAPVQMELVKNKQMEYYYPIINTSECWGCHTRESGSIRGVGKPISGGAMLGCIAVSSTRPSPPRRRSAGRGCLVQPFDSMFLVAFHGSTSNVGGIYAMAGDPSMNAGLHLGQVSDASAPHGLILDPACARTPRPAAWTRRAASITMRATPALAVQSSVDSWTRRPGDALVSRDDASPYSDPQLTSSYDRLALPHHFAESGRDVVEWRCCPPALSFSM